MSAPIKPCENSRLADLNNAENLLADDLAA